MSSGLKSITPCDFEGICPYGAEYYGTCDWYCGADEPQDDPAIWEEDTEEEGGEV